MTHSLRPIYSIKKKKKAFSYRRERDISISIYATYTGKFRLSSARKSLEVFRKIAVKFNSEKNKKNTASTQRNLFILKCHPERMKNQSHN